MSATKDLAAEEARKLDAEVAVEIMGWAWMQNTHTKKCAVIPPEGGVRERLNGCDSDWETLKTPPSASERYSDWDRAGLSRPARGIVSIGIPYYSTDIAAAWDMEEEIQRRGLVAEYGEAMSVLLDSPFVTASYYDFLHASPSPVLQWEHSCLPPFCPPPRRARRP